jgi:hypothetical protein
MVESKRIRIVTNIDYGIDIEYNEDIVAVHFPYFNKFTKSTYLSIFDDTERFCDFFRVAGYKKLHAAVDHDNIKIKKLLKKLSFTRVGISGDLDIFEKEN